MPVPTGEGWLYVALVLDLYARKLVGWAMSATMPQELTLCALDVALGWRKPDAGLVHHSRRGSQYAANDYRNKLQARGITVSMSRKGDCWDNAPMESVNGTLKVECVHDVHFETREQAEQAIVEYIGYYNTEHRHSALGYVTPAEFERRWLVHEYTAQPGGTPASWRGPGQRPRQFTQHSTTNSPSPRGTARYPCDGQFRFVASARAGRRKIARIASWRPPYGDRFNETQGLIEVLKPQRSAPSAASACAASAIRSSTASSPTEKRTSVPRHPGRDRIDARS